MSQFSLSFCLTLFHSIWQSALLVILYFIIQALFRKQVPSLKKNILYLLLFTQLIISLFTFFIYQTGSLIFFTDIIETNIFAALNKQLVLQMISPWIIAVYMAVIMFKTIYLIYNWQRFKLTVTKNLIKPTIDLRLFTMIKANEFGINRKVNLWFSNIVSTPLTFGFFKPVILMPVALLNQLSIAETESLIIHELTHIKNNDYLFNWLLIIADTFFFFNPFIKIITNKIKLEREINCDIHVLQFKYPVVNYAETLLKTAKFKGNIKSFQLTAVFKNKQLLQRIRFFTTEKNLSFNKTNSSLISFSLIITAITINLFLLTQIKKDTSLKINNYAEIKYKADGNNLSFTNSIAATVPNNQSAVMNQLPQISSIDKPLHIQLKPINKIIEQQTIAAVNNVAEENYAIQAASVQVNEKEIILKEENSVTGKSVTKAYKLVWKNGKWNDELLWMMTETRPKNDSICYLKDTLSRYIPAVQ